MLIYDLHSSGDDRQHLEEVVRRADGRAGRRRPVLLKARRASTTPVVEYTFQFGDVFAQLPYLLGGALVTLQIAFVSFWVGTVIGIAGAMSRVYGGAAGAAGRQRLRHVLHQYAGARAGLPSLLRAARRGVLLRPMTAVLIGLTLNAGAYLTEILRAGVISVRRSEMEAAITLGMSRLQILRFVMLPHIAKTIYAPLSNFFVWMVLGSSLAALVRRRRADWPRHQHQHRQPAHDRDVRRGRRSSTWCSRCSRAPRWPWSDAGCFASRRRCSDVRAHPGGRSAVLRREQSAVHCCRQWAAPWR